MSLEMPIYHSCRVVCPYCGNNAIYDFNIEEIDANGCYERGMGQEISYEYDTYVTCNNPNCNKEIEVTGEVWEYPEGALNLVTP